MGILSLILAGCGAPPDIGNNNPNVVVALGDSITAGTTGDGTPYPAQLAWLSGKTVINAGIGGERAADGLSRIGGVLATNKPGFILILYGAGDAIKRTDSEAAVASVRDMVRQAKANKTVPIIATLPPMIGSHAGWEPRAERISAGIRDIARQERVPLVDMKEEFPDPRQQLMPDGLHPNSLGNRSIARAFNAALASAGAFSIQPAKVVGKERRGNTILWIGAGFWLLTLLLLWQTLRPIAEDGPLLANGKEWLAAFLLLALAAVLCFRPEEIVFSGEDPGAYLNTAAELGRQGHLFYRDSLLAELPQDQKLAFRYGHEGFGLTKDAALWINDLATGTMGSWFQPAYPLIMAAAARVLPEYVIFLVAPLFAILNALLLAAIARYLTGRRLAGALAFLLYLLNPVIAWNSRCPRPEMLASFFVLAGVFLLVRLLRGDAPFTFRRAFLAGLSLGLAPLLHITALYVLAPACIVFLCLARRNVGGWIGWWVGVVGGIVLLLLEIHYVTDCYFLWRYLNPAGRVVKMAFAGGMLILASMAIACFASRVRDRFVTVVLARQRTIGLAAAVMSVFLYVYVFFFRTREGTIPFLPAGTAPYLSLTDFREIVLLMSWPLAVAAVLGGVVLVCRRDARWGVRLLFLLVLFPSIATIGWMTHFMFETRRAVLTLAPVLALSVAGGLCLLDPRRSAAGRGTIWLVALLLLAWPVADRLALYRTWNLKGVYAFYRDVAADVKPGNGIVIGEYTPQISPLEHFFGIPVLSMDPDHRGDEDYRAAETAICDLLKRHADRPVYLVTPFAQPVIPGVALERMAYRSLRTPSLARETGRLPRDVRSRTVALDVYRMAPLEAHPEASLPFTRTLDTGRFGCAGLAKNKMPVRSEIWSGVVCPVSSPVEVSWTAPRRGAVSEIDFFFFGAATESPAGHIAAGDRALEVKWFPLGEGWCMAAVCLEPGADVTGVRVGVSDGLTLMQVNVIDDVASSRVELTVDKQAERSVEVPLGSCWLRQEAALALPDGMEKGVRLFLLARTGRTGDEPVRVAVSRGPDGHTAPAVIQAGWSWSSVTLPASDSPSAQSRFVLKTESAWDSHVSGFPKDLGFRLSRASALPVLR